MPIEVFCRKEIKYLTRVELYPEIEKELLKYMVLDEFNHKEPFYPICNLYYDTPTNQLIRNSLDKPQYKEKLRLRCYGVPEADTLVYLEIKKKYRGMVSKRRTRIALSDAYAYIGGAPMPIMPYTNVQIAKELNWFLKVHGPLYPKTVVQYNRRAYFAKNDRNIRVTFDKDILTRRYDTDPSLGIYGDPLLPKGYMIMEVKVPTKVIPLWLVEILSKFELRHKSMSKYGMEYRKFLRESKEDKDVRIDDANF